MIQQSTSIPEIQTLRWLRLGLIVLVCVLSGCAKTDFADESDSPSGKYHAGAGRLNPREVLHAWPKPTAKRPPTPTVASSTFAAKKMGKSETVSRFHFP